ncbi:DUF6153 family protein [Streptomyces ovatisporus]|uniref:DUF6153 family protein n=1 Tax=Streptomyces ovatisporus TaxID=1128682 RepID=A0ABV9A6V4_9ACTN
MRRRPQRAARPREGRAYVLLVLAVLAGVIAMHGLGAAAADVPASGSSHHGSSIVSASPEGHDCSCDCAHAGEDDGTSGGHTEHADQLCVASGISSAPVAPSLAPSGVAETGAVHLPVRAPASDHAGGRAPPSLSELQLLRI